MSLRNAVVGMYESLSGGTPAGSVLIRRDGRPLAAQARDLLAVSDERIESERAAAIDDEAGPIERATSALRSALATADRRRPPACPTCTAALGREVRHARRRLCSLVQAQARYAASEAGREANRENQRRRREGAMGRVR